jgi:hypothetical protein
LCDTEFFIEVPAFPPSAKDGGSPGSIGDPHFETWYEQRYDFHGICDLVLVSSASFMNNLGLDIHIRTSERVGTGYISAAVIKIGNDKLEVHQDGSFYWNNSPTTSLPDRFGEATISYMVYGGWLPIWEITTKSGGKIFVQVFDFMVDVELYGFENENMTDAIGLMGDFETGFLLDRNGNWVFDTDQFGHEWQVRDYEEMLFLDEREPQFPTTCQMPNAAERSRRLERSSISEERANEICAHAEHYFWECTQDTRLTGNKEMGKYYAFLSQRLAEHRAQRPGHEPPTVNKQTPQGKPNS